MSELDKLLGVADGTYGTKGNEEQPSTEEGAPVNYESEFVQASEASKSEKRTGFWEGIGSVVGGVADWVGDTWDHMVDNEDEDLGVKDWKKYKSLQDELSFGSTVGKLTKEDYDKRLLQARDEGILSERYFIEQRKAQNDIASQTTSASELSSKIRRDLTSQLAMHYAQSTTDPQAVRILNQAVETQTDTIMDYYNRINESDDELDKAKYFKELSELIDQSKGFIQDYADNVLKTKDNKAAYQFAEDNNIGIVKSMDNFNKRFITDSKWSGVAGSFNRLTDLDVGLNDIGNLYGVATGLVNAVTSLVVGSPLRAGKTAIGSYNSGLEELALDYIETPTDGWGKMVRGKFVQGIGEMWDGADRIGEALVPFVGLAKLGLLSKAENAVRLVDKATKTGRIMTTAGHFAVQMAQDTLIFDNMFQSFAGRGSNQEEIETNMLTNIAFNSVFSTVLARPIMRGGKEFLETIGRDGGFFVQTQEVIDALARGDTKTAEQLGYANMIRFKKGEILEPGDVFSLGEQARRDWQRIASSLSDKLKKMNDDPYSDEAMKGFSHINENAKRMGVDISSTKLLGGPTAIDSGRAIVAMPSEEALRRQEKVLDDVIETIVTSKKESGERMFKQHLNNEALVQNLDEAIARTKQQATVLTRLPQYNFTDEVASVIREKLLATKNGINPTPATEIERQHIAKILENFDDVIREMPDITNIVPEGQIPVSKITSQFKTRAPLKTYDEAAALVTERIQPDTKDYAKHIDAQINYGSALKPANSFFPANKGVIPSELIPLRNRLLKQFSEDGENVDVDKLKRMADMTGKKTFSPEEYTAIQIMHLPLVYTDLKAMVRTTYAKQVSPQTLYKSHPFFSLFIKQDDGGYIATKIMQESSSVEEALGRTFKEAAIKNVENLPIIKYGDLDPEFQNALVKQIASIARATNKTNGVAFWDFINTALIREGGSIASIEKFARANKEVGEELIQQLFKNILDRNVIIEGAAIQSYIKKIPTLPAAGSALFYTRKSSHEFLEQLDNFLTVHIEELRKIHGANVDLDTVKNILLAQGAGEMNTMAQALDKVVQKLMYVKPQELKNISDVIRAEPSRAWLQKIVNSTNYSEFETARKNYMTYLADNAFEPDKYILLHEFLMLPKNFLGDRSEYKALIESLIDGKTADIQHFVNYVKTKVHFQSIKSLEQARNAVNDILEKTNLLKIKEKKENVFNIKKVSDKAMKKMTAPKIVPAKKPEVILPKNGVDKVGSPLDDIVSDEVFNLGDFSKIDKATIVVTGDDQYMKQIAVVRSANPNVRFVTTEEFSNFIYNRTTQLKSGVAVDIEAERGRFFITRNAYDRFNIEYTKGNSDKIFKNQVDGMNNSKALVGDKKLFTVLPIDIVMKGQGKDEYLQVLSQEKAIATLVNETNTIIESGLFDAESIKALNTGLNNKAVTLETLLQNGVDGAKARQIFDIAMKGTGMELVWSQLRRYVPLGHNVEFSKYLESPTLDIAYKNYLDQINNILPTKFYQWFDATNIDRKRLRGLSVADKRKYIEKIQNDMLGYAEEIKTYPWIKDFMGLTREEYLSYSRLMTIAASNQAPTEVSKKALRLQIESNLIRSFYSETAERSKTGRFLTFIMLNDMMKMPGGYLVPPNLGTRELMRIVDKLDTETVQVIGKIYADAIDAEKLDIKLLKGDIDSWAGRIKEALRTDKSLESQAEIWGLSPDKRLFEDTEIADDIIDRADADMTEVAKAEVDIGEDILSGIDARATGEAPVTQADEINGANLSAAQDLENAPIYDLFKLLATRFNKTLDNMMSSLYTYENFVPYINTSKNLEDLRAMESNKKFIIGANTYENKIPDYFITPTRYDTGDHDLFLGDMKHANFYVYDGKYWKPVYDKESAQQALFSGLQNKLYDTKVKKPVIQLVGIPKTSPVEYSREYSNFLLKGEDGKMKPLMWNELEIRPYYLSGNDGLTKSPIYKLAFDNNGKTFLKNFEEWVYKKGDVPDVPFDDATIAAARKTAEDEIRQFKIQQLTKERNLKQLNKVLSSESETTIAFLKNFIENDLDALRTEIANSMQGKIKASKPKELDKYYVKRVYNKFAFALEEDSYLKSLRNGSLEKDISDEVRAVLISKLKPERYKELTADGTLKKHIIDNVMQDLMKKFDPISYGKLIDPQDTEKYINSRMKEHLLPQLEGVLSKTQLDELLPEKITADVVSVSKEEIDAAYKRYLPKKPKSSRFTSIPAFGAPEGTKLLDDEMSPSAMGIKDQQKANYATAFIGYGDPGSSTYRYYADAKADARAINKTPIKINKVEIQQSNGSKYIQGDFDNLQEGSFITLGLDQRLEWRDHYIINSIDKKNKRYYVSDYYPIRVNEEIQPRGSVAFVSVQGDGKYVAETIAQAKRVLDYGGTIIMDKSGKKKGEAFSIHNEKGEGAVQNALGKPSGKTEEGFNYWGPAPKKLEKPRLILNPKPEKGKYLTDVSDKMRLYKKYLAAYEPSASIDGQVNVQRNLFEETVYTDEATATLRKELLADGTVDKTIKAILKEDPIKTVRLKEYYPDILIEPRAGEEGFSRVIKATKPFTSDIDAETELYKFINEDTGFENVNLSDVTDETDLIENGLFEVITVTGSRFDMQLKDAKLSSITPSKPKTALLNATPDYPTHFGTMDKDEFAITMKRVDKELANLKKQSEYSDVAKERIAYLNNVKEFAEQSRKAMDDLEDVLDITC